MKEFVRQTIDEMLASLSAEERLEGLSWKERLGGLSVEKRLEGLSIDEIVSGMSPEIREALAKKLSSPASSGQTQ